MNSKKYARVHSIAWLGTSIFPMEVECYQSVQLPSFHIVGLPNTCVKEARERVQSALLASGFPLPSRKIVVNLTPASVRKEGAGYDLPIALAYLAASGVIQQKKIDNYVVLGELALNGELKSVPKAFLLKRLLREKRFSGAIIPAENSEILKNDPEFCKNGGGFHSLKEVVAYLQEKNVPRAAYFPISTPQKCIQEMEWPDFSEIQGLEGPKKVLEISIAGSHSLLFSGPRGHGKSLLLQAMRGILPKLTSVEQEEVETNYLLAEIKPPKMMPIRQPHNSISDAGMMGWQNGKRPGEIVLSHRGILILDEFLEFSRNSLEALRVPLERGVLELPKRGGGIHGIEPASFLLIAATNSCPCGVLGDIFKKCGCAMGEIHRYQRRLSEAMLDRFDLRMEVERKESFPSLKAPDCSLEVQKRVIRARNRMINRQGVVNAKLSQKELLELQGHFWSPAAKKLFIHYRGTENIGFRALFAIARVSNTIADLSAAKEVQEAHVLEAYSYRFNWSWPNQRVPLGV